MEDNKTYLATQIEGTNNGWCVTCDQSEEKGIVFCRSDANTADDAVALYLESLVPRTGDEVQIEG